MVTKRAWWIFVAISASLCLLGTIQPVCAEDETPVSPVEAEDQQVVTQESEVSEPETAVEEKPAEEEQEAAEHESTTHTDAEEETPAAELTTEEEFLLTVLDSSDNSSAEVNETSKSKRYVTFPGIPKRTCVSDFQCPSGHSCRPARIGAMHYEEKYCVPVSLGPSTFPGYDDDFKINEAAILSMILLIEAQPQRDIPDYPDYSGPIPYQRPEPYRYQRPEPYQYQRPEPYTYSRPQQIEYPGPQDPYPFPGHGHDWPNPGDNPPAMGRSHLGPVAHPSMIYPPVDDGDQESLALMLLVFQDEGEAPVLPFNIRGGAPVLPFETRGGAPILPFNKQPIDIRSGTDNQGNKFTFVNSGSVFKNNKINIGGVPVQFPESRDDDRIQYGTSTNYNPDGSYSTTSTSSTSSGNTVVSGQQSNLVIDNADVRNLNVDLSGVNAAIVNEGLCRPGCDKQIGHFCIRKGSSAPYCAPFPAGENRPVITGTHFETHTTTVSSSGATTVDPSMCPRPCRIEEGEVCVQDIRGRRSCACAPGSRRQLGSRECTDISSIIDAGTVVETSEQQKSVNVIPVEMCPLECLDELDEVCLEESSGDRYCGCAPLSKRHPISKKCLGPQLTMPGPISFPRPPRPVRPTRLRPPRPTVPKFPPGISYP